jgi:hypothetical protein
MAVSQLSQRETSFFSIAKLLQTALANAAHGRLHIFWRPVTAHLLEVPWHSLYNFKKLLFSSVPIRMPAPGNGAPSR